ncbi:zinc finger protein RFP-like [Podarcis muralis]
MADEKRRKSFQQEVTCPICFCYYTSPVVLDCGHCFCRMCIVRCWEEPGRDSRCPECRSTVARNLKVSRNISNFVKMLRDWDASAEREARRRRSECQRHQQPLDLFCEDERVPFCGDCAGPQEHRGHRVVSVEEAVQVYKRQIEREKEKTVAEFRRLHQFLEEQEDLLLEKMQELEEEIARKREEHLDRLSRDLIPLETLILEMEKRLQRPTSEVLPDIGSLLKTFEEREVIKTPVVFSPALNWRAWEFSDMNPFLEGVIQEFKDALTSDLKYLKKAKVTLDPETAHPQLILSADRLSVTCGDMCEEVPDNPKRFNQLTVVLGREAFTEGRYSWEVTVGNEEEWALGVARKSVRRKGMFNFTPQEGVWAMGKWRGQYRALSDNPYHLHPSGELRRIRVTLNYTGQRVAFFDVDRGIALLAFAGGSFSGEDLLPFFWLQERAHLRLSP